MNPKVHVSYKGKEILLPANTFFNILLDTQQSLEQAQRNRQLLKKKLTPSQSNRLHVAEQILELL